MTKLTLLGVGKGYSSLHFNDRFIGGRTGILRYMKIVVESDRRPICWRLEIFQKRSSLHVHVKGPWVS